VTATDTKTATIKGSQAGIVVKAAAVKTLVVSGSARADCGFDRQHPGYRGRRLWQPHP